MRLRKLFKLPGPSELGWSDYDALESREFSDEPKGKTWEDWHEHVKSAYPVRYFLAETLTDFILYSIYHPIRRPIAAAYYWLKCHTLPSYRFHLLDLRQSDYRYGWRDVPEKMLYAMFNLLGEYLNKEEPHDLTQWYTREQIAADVALSRQQEAIDEARFIWKWWTVDRLSEERARSEMLNTWYSAKKSKDPKREEYWKTMNDMEAESEKKTDDMIARLMKIRRTLWT